MIKIAVFADLHLPDSADTVKERVFDWALAEAKERGAELLVGAGDLSGVGTALAARRIRAKFEATGIAFLLTPGNAELRSPVEMELALELLRTPEASGPVVLLDSSTGRLAQESRKKLKKHLAGPAGNLMAVTHLPPEAMREKDRALLEKAVERHVFGRIVAGHWHRDISGGALELVRGLDPDKAVGGAPALAFFTLDDAGRWSREDVSCPIADPRSWPEAERREWFDLLGFSGMARPLEALLFAVEHRVGVVELRQDTVAALPVEPLKALIGQWRAAGGRRLSMHLADLGMRSGAEFGAEEVRRGAQLAVALGCDAVTFHVPRVTVGTIELPEVRRKLLAVTAEALKPLAAANVTVGIENLHMCPGEQPDDDRGFGYTVPECGDWIADLRAEMGFDRVGLHFDLGHARNNAPYSSRFTLSDWYAAMGRRITGFHLHQVRVEPDGSFENHTMLTELFGELISLSSLFLAWRCGMVNHAPMYLEIREGSGTECYLALKKQLGLE